MQTTHSLDEITRMFLSESDVQPSTKETYKSILIAFYMWASQNIADKHSVQKADLLKYKLHLQQNCTGSTGYLYFVVLKKYFEWMEEKTFYPDIAKDIKLPARKKGFTRKPLTKQQARQLLESARTAESNNIRDYLILKLLLTAGLRIIEVSRLSIGSLDSSGDDIKIIHIQPKGSTEDTTFREITDIYPLFTKYLEQRRETLPSDPLFISNSFRNKGQRLSTQAIRIIVKKYLRQIGITDPAISPHSLRHSQATILLQDGFSIYDVQQHLGHSRTSTTEIYLRYAAEQLKRANKTGKHLRKIL